MLDFKTLELADKPVIDPFFAAWKCENSEFTFSNLFMWRLSWNIRYCVVDETLFIMLHHKRFKPFFFAPIPLKPGKDLCGAMERIFEYSREEGITFKVRSVTEKMREILERSCPGKLSFHFDANVQDYVYNTRDLIELPGKKYHSKRNHINKLISLYSTVKYEKMTPEHVPGCLELYDEWMCKKGNDEMYRDERDAVREGLTNFEALGLRGCVVKIADKIQAFSLGERITDNMALIHMEKANDDIPGLYAYINQKFAETEWSDTEFINREEDMGIEGLRKAKESYHPVRFVRKYEVRLK